VKEENLSRVVTATFHPLMPLKSLKQAKDGTNIAIVDKDVPSTLRKNNAPNKSVLSQSDDPLSEMLSYPISITEKEVSNLTTIVTYDPLSVISSTEGIKHVSSRNDNSKFILGPWVQVKQRIRQEFCFSGSISFNSNTLNEVC